LFWQKCKIELQQTKGWAIEAVAALPFSCKALQANSANRSLNEIIKLKAPKKIWNNKY
jgi:hypothetical protein